MTLLKGRSPCQPSLGRSQWLEPCGVISGDLSAMAQKDGGSGNCPPDTGSHCCILLSSCGRAEVRGPPALPAETCPLFPRCRLCRPHGVGGSPLSCGFPQDRCPVPESLLSAPGLQTSGRAGTTWWSRLLWIPFISVFQHHQMSSGSFSQRLTQKRLARLHPPLQPAWAAGPSPCSGHGTGATVRSSSVRGADRWARGTGSCCPRDGRAALLACPAPGA